MSKQLIGVLWRFQHKLAYIAPWKSKKDPHLPTLVNIKVGSPPNTLDHFKMLTAYYVNRVMMRH